MAVTGIGISDDHLLKILGFRLILVAAGGHLGSKIARTLPNLKGGPKPPNIGSPDRLVEKFETQIYSTWTFASQAQLFQM